MPGPALTYTEDAEQFYQRHMQFIVMQQYPLPCTPATVPFYLYSYEAAPQHLHSFVLLLTLTKPWFGHTAYRSHMRRV